MKRQIAILYAILGVAILGLIGSIAMAQGTSSPSSEHHLRGTYLSGQEACWNAFPKAPTLGSAVDLADLGITLSIQSSRCEAQNAEAFRDEKYSIKLVTDLIDPAFESKYSKTWNVLSLADKDAYFITSFLKKKNSRLRPYIQHPTLVLPLFHAGDFSYPSGHSSGTQLQALILGSLFPDRAAELLSRARQVADSRVVAGVHYTSDTEAGLNLGAMIYKELMASVTFRCDLKSASKADGISH